MWTELLVRFLVEIAAKLGAEVIARVWRRLRRRISILQDWWDDRCPCCGGRKWSRLPRYRGEQ